MPEKSDQTVVGIALVSRGGLWLVRKRPEAPGSPMPGYWEFPGGKCESGESPADAARRECLEESGLEVEVSRLRRRTIHEYPHGIVDLHYFDCKPLQATAEPGQDSGFCWKKAAQLAGLQFPDANETVVAELIQEARGRAVPGSMTDS